MLSTHISLTYTTDGIEDRTSHAAHRSGEEGSVRAPLRESGPHALAGRPSAHPRLPDAARRALHAERHERGEGAQALNARAWTAFSSRRAGSLSTGCSSSPPAGCWSASS